VESEPEPKQFWMTGTGAKIFRWWSRSRSLKFGFRFHSPNLGQASCTNNAVFFIFQWTKSFWSRNEKRLDVGTGAGAKYFRYLEPEPDI